MLTVLQPQKGTATLEGIDHLFLLPERALAMDSAHLQKDLAGLDFDPRLLHEAPMGNVWLSGSRPSSAKAEEREVRIKQLKEKQNEERQKKLEEIKSQALAAQRFREQKEQERRARLEEMRIRDLDRRQQVEERKRMINEAERDRLESILKKNQERESRIELKRRNERSSNVFAFGSSTPRMLEPHDTGGSYWGYRRATSTTNIMYNPVPLTRRQSERELDGGSKKRATSAGGLERSEEGTAPQSPAGCASGHVGRRRTDLMPTIPSKEGLSSSARKPFTKSPGRAYSMSRLDQLAKPRKRLAELPPLTESPTKPTRSQSATTNSSSSSVSRTRSMSHLAIGKIVPAPQKPLRKSDSRSMHQLTVTSPLPPPRPNRATQLRQQKRASNEAPSRPSSALSQQSTNSVASSVTMRSRPVAAPRRPRPISIAVTGITIDALKNGEKKPDSKPPLPKSRKSSFVKSQEKIKSAKSSNKNLQSPTDSGTPKSLQSPTTAQPPIVAAEETDSKAGSETNIKISAKEEPPAIQEQQQPLLDIVNDAIQSTEVKVETVVTATANAESNVELLLDLSSTEETIPQNIVQSVPDVVETVEPIIDKVEEISVQPVPTQTEQPSIDELNENVDMTASMIAKVRITTEEEAKAALAERRRLAREEAERLAEQERLRIEEEARFEFERQQREEEQQRMLVEMQRRAEQERLEEAIKETQRREEEDRLRREEEHRQKIIKEEQDRKAREEAERQKAELQERLKNEEKEREARRKRVEAIMLRTRGKGGNTGSIQNDDKNEENKSETINGSKSESSENCHKNGKDLETVDNIIPVDSIKNANTVNVETLNADDTINSNDPTVWQRNTTDLLM